MRHRRHGHNHSGSQRGDGGCGDYREQDDPVAATARPHAARQKEQESGSKNNCSDVEDVLTKLEERLWSSQPSGRVMPAAINAKAVPRWSGSSASSTPVVTNSAVARRFTAVTSG